jgi:hypothetical protein
MHTEIPNRIAKYDLTLFLNSYALFLCRISIGKTLDDRNVGITNKNSKILYEKPYKPTSIFDLYIDRIIVSTLK